MEFGGSFRKREKAGEDFLWAICAQGIWVQAAQSQSFGPGEFRLPVRALGHGLVALAGYFGSYQESDVPKRVDDWPCLDPDVVIERLSRSVYFVSTIES